MNESIETSRGNAQFRAVLFDFGGVIMSSPFDGFASYERKNGLPEGIIRTINSNNHLDNAWARLERGETDFDTFVTTFEAEALALGHRVNAVEMLMEVRGEIRPEMVNAVSICKEHFKTGLLTNNFPIGAHDRHGGEDFESLFDLILESHKAGVRKPDPKFYEIACSELGIHPTEAIFLDDLGINLKPARQMGMTTIKVTDPGQAISELSGLIGITLDGNGIGTTDG